MSALLTQDDLLEWTGFRQAADLRKWLDERKIPYEGGKGRRICTTQAAVDAHFLRTDHSSSPPVEIEI